MCWPALWNGYPLLYPDSISYVDDGRGVLQALLHRGTGFAGMRSEMYSLGIYLVHWKRSPWPVVGMQALIVAWVVWLVVRALLPRRPVLAYLAIIVALAGLTSVSWYVCVVMPDVLGAVAYLGMYLLVFAPETLGRGERWGVMALIWWGLTAHPTHLMLAVGLAGMLGLLLAVRWPAMRGRGRALAVVGALAVLAAGAQMALHWRLYGKATLSGNRPPYLMARVVADGPGTWYLRAHCGTLGWAICAQVDNLPDNDDAFLWGDHGVWPSADAATQQRLLAEEMPLVKAAVIAYPRAQFDRSMANFRSQLNDFGVDDFDNNEWMEASIGQVFPGAEGPYSRTREKRDALRTNGWTRLQRRAMWVSLAMLAGLLPVLWRRVGVQGLMAIVLPVVVANALLTAVLSSNDSRYQARVVWLVPMAAFVLAGMWIEGRAGLRSGGDVSG
jgi:hypothetical protein